MELIDYKGQYYEYCDAFVNDYKCLSKATFYFTTWHRPFSFSEIESLIMEVYDKKPIKSLESVLHTFFTIATITCWFVVSRVTTQKLACYAKCNTLWLRFLIEFFLIAIPCILCVNLFNKWVELIVLSTAGMMFLIVCRSKCFQKAKTIKFDLGSRPYMFTLLRSTVYIWTVLCILAIDFESFPKDFRKSRSYGAALMDVGIGLFITVMAMVSRRLKSLSACKNTILATLILLILGTARTLVVMFLNYGQDEHEYGKHFNAFFILAFTKLFGSLISAIARNDMQLLPLAVGVIGIHELILQCGLQDYVISPEVARDSFFSANREGISSIPGFVGLYLICIFIYKNLNLKGILDFEELFKTIKVLFGLVFVFTFLTITSIFSIGISRVTCNFGYIVWMVDITLVMSLIYLIVFDLLLNILMPTSSPLNVIGDTLEEGPTKQKEADNTNFLPIPVLADAVNMNGLVYFMIGNFLTGFVNIFLDPGSRGSLESIIILTFYLFISTGFVFILYAFKIRIA